MENKCIYDFDNNQNITCLMTSINIKGESINWKFREIVYTSKVLWEAYKNYFSRGLNSIIKPTNTEKYRYKHKASVK